MSPITFHPILFEYRSKAIEALETADLRWLVDYKAFDLMHQEFGLQCTGIEECSVARRIFVILKKTFPEWRQGRIYYKDFGLEEGWIVELHKFQERNDSWRTGDGG